MNAAERLHRRRCIGLRIAVVFAILLAAVSWGDWPVMAVAAAGGLVALGVYLKDCRRPAPKPAQTDAPTREANG
jgi:hypothetical protein